MNMITRLLSLSVILVFLTGCGAEQAPADETFSKPIEIVHANEQETTTPPAEKASAVASKPAQHFFTEEDATLLVQDYLAKANRFTEDSGYFIGVISSVDDEYLINFTKTVGRRTTIEGWFHVNGQTKELEEFTNAPEKNHFIASFLSRANGNEA